MYNSSKLAFASFNFVKKKQLKMYNLKEKIILILREGKKGKELMIYFDKWFYHRNII